MKVHGVLAGVASGQHALVTLADAGKVGVSRRQVQRRVTAGELVLVHRGVYRIGGAPRTDRQELLAACLGAGHGVASHRSAGALWGLSRVHSAGPEILVAGTTRPRLAGVVVHRTDAIDTADITELDGIPLTTVPRTVLDLGAVLRPERVESAMEDAVLRLGVSIAELRACLDRLAARGRNGCGVLRALLDARDPTVAAPASELELALLRLIRAHDLPEPKRQFCFEVPGRRTIIVDFAYPQAKLAIEADSRRWHAGRDDVQRNSDKKNLLTRLGWFLLSFTWLDVTQRPERVATDIRRSLSRTAP